MTADEFMRREANAAAAETAANRLVEAHAAELKAVQAKLDIARASWAILVRIRAAEARAAEYLDKLA